MRWNNNALMLSYVFSIVNDISPSLTLEDDCLRINFILNIFRTLSGTTYPCTVDLSGFKMKVQESQVGG